MFSYAFVEDIKDKLKLFNTGLCAILVRKYGPGPYGPGPLAPYGPGP